MIVLGCPGRMGYHPHSTGPFMPKDGTSYPQNLPFDRSLDFPRLKPDPGWHAADALEYRQRGFTSFSSPGVPGLFLDREDFHEIGAHRPS
jgi:hypothetical protein